MMRSRVDEDVAVLRLFCVTDEPDIAWAEVARRAKVFMEIRETTQFRSANTPFMDAVLSVYCDVIAGRFP